MSDILCSKIGGIWCYWPGSEIISGLIKTAIVIIFVLLILFFLKKNLCNKLLRIKNIHAGKKTKKKS